MPELPAPFVARTAASTAFLQHTLQRMVARVAEYNTDIAQAYEHAMRIAVGGKHLRATLVHVGADRPIDAPPHAADTAVAAAFDLLHASFLILDDVIDADETRRGYPTIHAAARDRSGNAHYGESVAILAGTAALNTATHIVANCGANADITLRVLTEFTEATEDSMIGEFMDIHHSLPHVTPSDRSIHLASRLKTSAYSFEAPLACGALLGGHAERGEQLVRIGRHLGTAYQMADDLQSVFGSPARTGKDPAGDLLHGRATPLIATARATPHWPKIEQAITTQDWEQARELFRECGAAARSAQRAADHLDTAAALAADTPLSTPAQAVLTVVGAAIRENTRV
ncbi:polyprenyl synthetase family protein [Corynebacterium sp.]|uniref:polyprenyl synthetase family protein n=1 Tax=Corynebacterium sp. TaxID=1720 RepID=UPI0026DB0025|nr:polyprenyl synthetase family protein [Corynebacterium sp.]MDO5076061.1 polyprenyl synthetase family protein [Corynebacterium sp.]